MGLLLFVVAQVFTYAALWWLLAAGRPPQQMSTYFVGMLHASLIIALSFGAPRIYGYFRSRGWVASPRMWLSRVAFQVRTDWVRQPQGWDMDFARVQMRRVRTEGVLYLTFALLGFQLHFRVLIDEAEANRFREARQQARDAYVESLPPMVRPAMREMMKTIPLDANVEVGAIPLTTHDVDADGHDDDDDDERVH